MCFIVFITPEICKNVLDVKFSDNKKSIHVELCIFSLSVFSRSFYLFIFQRWICQLKSWRVVAITGISSIKNYYITLKSSYLLIDNSVIYCTEIWDIDSSRIKFGAIPFIR